MQRYKVSTLIVLIFRGLCKLKFIRAFQAKVRRLDDGYYALKNIVEECMTNVYVCEKKRDRNMCEYMIERAQVKER